jgi:hypothetical protein
VTTILHISDLHRDLDSELTTDALLESLRRDRGRYIEEKIAPPDLAVVSGDLVLGVKDDSDAGRLELKRQYDEAGEFLGKLADLMFSGDHSKIVIVPGNHDVSHAHVLRATTPVEIPIEPHKREALAQELSRTNSLHRWNAREFAVRHINDKQLYAQRMEPFAEFYLNFYRGTRIFPLDDGGQCEIFDFPELNLAIVGLSSCSDNDLFNRAGRIHPNCVATATMRISHLCNAGRVAIAVWHHNLSGGPKDSDYMDPEFLQSLMDGGFVLGLHGHQHRPQYIEHRFTADQRRALAVISAGTLCGGPRTLPSGRMRAYNLITVDSRTRKCHLHVRDMKNTSFSSPVWGPAHVHEFGGASIEFKINDPVRTASALVLASDAAALLRAGDPGKAYVEATKFPNDEFARRIAIEALDQLSNWSEMEHFCSPPQSPIEIIHLMNALYELGKKAALRELIQSDLVANSSDLGVRQTTEKMQSRLGGPK